MSYGFHQGKEIRTAMLNCMVLLSLLAPSVLIFSLLPRWKIRKDIRMRNLERWQCIGAYGLLVWVQAIWLYSLFWEWSSVHTHTHTQKKESCDFLEKLHKICSENRTWSQICLLLYTDILSPSYLYCLLWDWKSIIKGKIYLYISYG